jgi:ribokinase
MVSLLVCGAINWDISCFVERLPVRGEEITIKEITRVSGGTGGNVAVAAARVLGTKQVALIGALGNDDIACQQIATLEDEGILTDGIDHIEAEESGQAYIMIDRAGQNIIASYLGANAKLGIKQLKKTQIKQQLQECRGIALTDPPFEVAEELIDLAKRRDIPVLWDPGILIGPSLETLLSLARRTEVLFLNETEAKALLGTDKLNASLQKLKEVGFRNHIVLKLGAQGAAMLEPASGTVTKIPTLPLKELGLNVVSTVGCGDIFAGVFAAYHIMGSSLTQSLVMAGTAACLNATRPETRGSPDRAILETMERRCHDLGFTVQEYRSSKDC